MRIKYSKKKEIEEGQLNAIKNQDIDFIVAILEDTPEDTVLTNYMRDLATTEYEMYNAFNDYGYHVVDTFYDDIYNGTFYLYELEE